MERYFALKISFLIFRGTKNSVLKILQPLMNGFLKKNTCIVTQLTFTCLKSTIETLENRLKYDQNQQ